MEGQKDNNKIEFLKINDFMKSMENKPKFINIYCKMIKDIKTKFGINELCKVITIRDNKNNIIKQEENVMISIPKKKLDGLAKRFFRITVLPNIKTFGDKEYYEHYYSQIPTKEFQFLDLYALSQQSQYNIQFDLEGNFDLEVE